MAVAAVVSVQTGVSLAVPVIHDHGALSTSSLRLCWAALALLLFVRPPLRRYDAAQWRAALILGGGMAVMSLSFFLAIERLPQHLTVALEFCGPLAVAALGARGWRALAWPLLAAAGIGLLVSGDARMAGGVDPAGIAFALLAAAGWGVYIVMMKRIGPAFPGLQGLAVSLMVAALLSRRSRRPRPARSGSPGSSWPARRAWRCWCRWCPTSWRSMPCDACLPPCSAC